MLSVLEADGRVLVFLLVVWLVAKSDVIARLHHDIVNAFDRWIAVIKDLPVPVILRRIERAVEHDHEIAERPVGWWLKSSVILGCKTKLRRIADLIICGF